MQVSRTITWNKPDEPRPRIICGACREDIDLVEPGDECPAYHER